MKKQLKSSVGVATFGVLIQKKGTWAL